jgi:hypothetical protein
VTKKDVVNLALARLNIPITPDLTDKDGYGKKALLAYPGIAKRVLMSYEWPDAMRWEELAEDDASTNNSDYTYMYDLSDLSATDISEEESSVLLYDETIAEVISLELAKWLAPGAGEEGRALIGYLREEAAMAWQTARNMAGITAASQEPDSGYWKDAD